jgi:hypothetical protein
VGAMPLPEWVMGVSDESPVDMFGGFTKGSGTRCLTGLFGVRGRLGKYFVNGILHDIPSSGIFRVQLSAVVLQMASGSRCKTSRVRSRSRLYA